MSHPIVVRELHGILRTRKALALVLLMAVAFAGRVVGFEAAAGFGAVAFAGAATFFAVVVAFGCATFDGLAVAFVRAASDFAGAVDRAGAFFTESRAGVRVATGFISSFGRPRRPTG